MADEIERLNKTFSADVKVVSGERSATAIISTSAVDREGDVLIPQGCYTKNYEKNPIVCYAHDSFYAPPVGKCVAIKRDDQTITAKLVFAERPASHPLNLEWFPDTLLSLYQQGVMNAFSVGFSPIEQRAATTRDQTKFGDGCQRVFSKWEMYEFSCVPVGMNQEAVSVAVSKGLLTQEQADKMFKKSEAATTDPPVKPSPEKAVDETPSPMQTCSKCQKDYIESEMMQDDDSAWICSTCSMEAKKSEETPTEPAPEKHVVREIETKGDGPRIKRIHRVLEDDSPKRTPVKRLIIHAVSGAMGKARGRLYPKQ
jgi:phage head maturation protease/ribosomal protein L37AE/L43A